MSRCIATETCICLLTWACSIPCSHTTPLPPRSTRPARLPITALSAGAVRGEEEAAAATALAEGGLEPRMHCRGRHLTLSLARICICRRSRKSLHGTVGTFQRAAHPKHFGCLVAEPHEHEPSCIQAQFETKALVGRFHGGDRRSSFANWMFLGLAVRSWYADSCLR